MGALNREEKPLNLAFMATRIAETIATADLVVVTDDDRQAEALAAAVRALLPLDRVFRIAASDALPGDVAPASPANAAQRIAALRGLRRTQRQEPRPRLICILSGEAAARRYPPPSTFDGEQPLLRVGDLLDLAAFATSLEELGYTADDRVDQPGEMAVRGDVIDIFPADGDLPARIELAEHRIVSIRSYDPLNQRSVAGHDRLEIAAAVEPPGAQATILDHLTPGVMVIAEQADRQRRRFIALAREAPAPGGGMDAVDDDGWAAAIEPWPIVAWDNAFTPVPRFVEARAPLAALARFVGPMLANGRSLLLAGSRRDLRFLKPKIARRLGIELGDVQDWAEVKALRAGAGAAMALPVDAGFCDERLVVVAAADLIGSRARIGDLPTGLGQPWRGSAEDIRIGDVVVHEDHGVALVAGLEPAPAAQDGPGELIALEYAGGGRRLVPGEEAGRIWRYGADADAVALDKLDGSSWRKRRIAIDAAIAESARALTALAVARAALTAPVIAPDNAAYERFAGRFPFNETADQARAIAAVRDDLASGKPMDRLIIGDVGYGKTEVALRAAGLAALAGYQVAVAAPTTVLVRQHLETFRRRFAGSGIAVAGLSRLSSAAERKSVKVGLADGSVRIVIGTAAVMGKDVAYARLGLVVIDEEQRFGTADKTRLRGSGDIHLLTLSATPIPRSLQMALVGLQQLSLIATPPARRQPIRTGIGAWDDGRIRTALLREKMRGGQSFVVVPRIEDIAGLAGKLQRIVPDLALVVAHGKLPAAEIDDVMLGFSQGSGDVLLATDIIEAGLDVPRANTMIVWRADRFGLAQLHQLRGRVGRGSRRGEVMLLTDTDAAIAEPTMKRLRTLETFDRLGAGFEISARDLDMRGAGDMLGDRQTGHLKLIGVALYQHLLSAALRQARGEDVERWTPELHLGSHGVLPERWIPEADVRLALYVRLARLEDDAGLDEFEAELLDRFGPLPPEAETLMAHARIRTAARALCVDRIDAGAAAIALTPRSGFAAQDQPGLCKKNGRLLLLEPTQDHERIGRVQTLLEEMAP